MRKIFFGKNSSGQAIELDLEAEGIRFILLAGATGSGKSVFEQHLYRDIAAKHTPEEVGFLLVDLTRGESIGCPPEYLVRPPVVDGKEAFEVLEQLEGEGHRLIVHIEECDLVSQDRPRLERLFRRLREGSNPPLIIYSTSRIDPEYLALWLKDFVDMRVVFRTASEADSTLLLGDDTAAHFQMPGERMLVYGGQKLHCLPFPDLPE